MDAEWTEWHEIIAALADAGLRCAILDPATHPAYTVTIRISGAYAGTWAGNLAQFRRFAAAVIPNNNHLHI